LELAEKLHRRVRGRRAGGGRNHAIRLARGRLAGRQWSP
jgi:hypothetical protein